MRWASFKYHHQPFNQLVNKIRLLSHIACLTIEIQGEHVIMWGRWKSASVGRLNTLFITSIKFTENLRVEMKKDAHTQSHAHSDITHVGSRLGLTSTLIIIIIRHPPTVWEPLIFGHRLDMLGKPWMVDYDLLISYSMRYSIGFGRFFLTLFSLFTKNWSLDIVCGLSKVSSFNNF